jgi:adenylate cyclase class IV
VPRRNLELKARDNDPERSLATCEALGAEAQGVLTQRDTYFNVAQGRLKLREERGATPHLIGYERPDLSGQRESRYRIVAVEDAEVLKAALSGALGVKVVVAKERRLYLWEGNVRIHIDAVEGMGNFRGRGAPDRLQPRCARIPVLRATRCSPTCCSSMGWATG